ncbi:hypothetical protein [Ensifer sp. SSB1]|jgi:hypothetical protein|uniref:hypothetical protein n=1 Tax=Ensifer sp. SSB1 TaxID=2795385 RepID=UPI0013B006EA|nr:hypothetical protein [Ensifer sp. SSB1]MBK5568893.1 hypothetical protein [Ensifer sp. SSB1]
MAGGTHNFVLGRSEATRERFPLGLLRLMFQAFPNAKPLRTFAGTACLSRAVPDAKPLRTFAETALNALAHNPKIEIDFGIMR